MTAIPDGALSLVADSYDVWNFVDNILASDELKSKVESRKGVIVVRPDSGDPVAVVKKVLEKLGDKFGTTNNAAGYKMLPNYLRVIQVNLSTFAIFA